MLKKSILVLLGGASLVMLPSCDKLEGVVGQVTELVGVDSVFEPKERREGIAKPHKASVDDVNQWLAEPNVLVVLDFYSEQCPPCLAMAPDLAALADQYGDKAAVMKLNVGKSGPVAQMANEEYKVTQTPTLKFFLNGKEVKSMRGSQSREEIDAVFARYTAKVDGEYVMREGEMPGNMSGRTVEDMMQRVSRNELPKGMTRVIVPTEAKDVTGDLRSVLASGKLTPVKSEKE
ncbi:thioredoxin family protein [Rubritalea sp.]|uniref:thioredoxin family protein n=1 Tax=Rubritalea sp. TaxID=2109375 RepID=UPI003EFADBCF